MKKWTVEAGGWRSWDVVYESRFRWLAVRALKKRAFCWNSVHHWRLKRDGEIVCTIYRYPGGIDWHEKELMRRVALIFLKPSDPLDPEGVFQRMSNPTFHGGPLDGVSSATYTVRRVYAPVKKPTEQVVQEILTSWEQDAPLPSTLAHDGMHVYQRDPDTGDYDWIGIRR